AWPDPERAAGRGVRASLVNLFFFQACQLIILGGSIQRVLAMAHRVFLPAVSQAGPQLLVNDHLLHVLQRRMLTHLLLKRQHVLIHRACVSPKYTIICSRIARRALLHHCRRPKTHRRRQCTSPQAPRGPSRRRTCRCAGRSRTAGDRD
uniref:Uncharacterized protein n=1 Tax=Mola mola TaxID=94237 RepID=A0A3Q3XC58_MOLML